MSKATISILGEPLKFLTSGKIAKNRFMKAAMSEYLCPWSQESDAKTKGVPSTRLINLYQKWGHGGFGMVLTGNLQVDQYHLESTGNLIIERSLDSEERRQAYQALTRGMKADGTLAIAQISHAGRQTPVFINPSPFSASDVQLQMKEMPGGFGKPVTLTTDQIRNDIVQRFVYAAKYCSDVGFDGVQLHCAHGYLLSQFISPTTNKRTDQYGGSLENRTRIVREIYSEIRKQVPNDFIVGAKVNSVEFQKDGLNTEDAAGVCKIFEDMGLDFIELSGGTYEHLAFQHERESTRKREAFFLEFTDTIVKKINRMPIYVTGGFRTANGMCKAVSSGATQGVGLGRPATQELDLPKKLLSGKSTAAIKSLIDQDNFFLTVNASNTQMAQAGKTPYKNDDELNKDIMDLSNQAVVDEFMKEVQKFTERTTKNIKSGKIVHDKIVEYRT